MYHLTAVLARSDDPGAALFSCGCSIIVMIVFGAIGRSMGAKKSVGPTGGMLLGALLGLIGLIIIAVSGDAAGSRPRRRHARGPIRRPGRHDEGEPLDYEEFEMRISCPKCGKNFTIKDESRAGKKAKCDDCGTVFRIPEAPR